MKKFLAILLCCVMALSLIGCGKQEEEPTTKAPKTTTAAPETPAAEQTTAKNDDKTTPSTAVPTTPAPTTPAQTTPAPTTPAPTTAEPTTAAPTTPEETVPPTTAEPEPAGSEAEAVFREFLNNMADLIEATANYGSGETRYLSAAGSLNVSARITAPASKEIEKGLDLTLYLKGEAEAGLNTDEGMEAILTYETDFQKFMAAMMGQDPDSAELLEGVQMMIADFTENRQYTYDPDEETWNSEAISPAEDSVIDRDEINEFSPDMIFAKYNFDKNDGKYVYSGKLQMELAEDLIDEYTDQLGSLGLTLDDIQPEIQLVLNEDKMLEKLSVRIPAFKVDLSSLGVKGLVVELEECELTLEADYSECHMEEIPEEIKNAQGSLKGKTYPELENAVIFENEVMKITAQNVCIDEYWGDFDMDLVFENKSDKTLTVSLESLIVNGYAVSEYVYCSLDAGGTDKDDITIDAEDLKQLGLSEPDEIRMHFQARESGVYDDTYLLDETVCVYPTGKTPEEIVIPERLTSDTEKVILDSDEYCFVILGIEKEEYSNGYQVLLYIENKTDKNLSVSWEDVKVQGKDIDAWFSDDIPAGSRMYSSVYFSESRMKDAGIDKISDLEFVLVIEDADDWFADPFLKETYVYP